MAKHAYTDKLVDWVVGYRVWIIVVCIALTLLGIIGAFRSGFNTDARVYFGPNNPERVALETMEARHGRYNTAVLLLAPHDGTVFSVTTLEALNAATRRVAEIPDIATTQSLANLVSMGSVPGWTRNEPLLHPEIPITAEMVSFIQDAMRQIPGEIKTLISATGHVAAINMLVTIHDGAPEKELITVEQLRDLKTDLTNEFPSIDFHLTGSAVLDATFMDAIRNDILLLVPFQIIAIVGLLLICLQSILVTGVLLLVLGVTCALTMGIAGWSGHELNGVTSATPMVLMGLAIANSIHLLLSWQQNLRTKLDQVAALKESVRINAFPIFLAALTTIISFLCLNFSDSPPFRQLGNLVAIGVAITFVLAFSLLPALTSYLPSKPAQNREKYEIALGKFGAWVARSRIFLILIFALVAIVSVWGASRIVFDDNFAQYFSERYEFRRSTDFFEENVSGLTVIEFSVPAENGIADPDYLRDLNRFSEWLRNQPNVTYVSNFADIVMATASAIPFLVTDNGLPQSESDADMVLNFIRQNMREDAPQGRPLSRDGNHSLVTAILSDASSSDIRSVSSHAEAWLQRETPSLATPATGMALLAANMSSRNTRAMVTGTIVALVLVSTILLFALRSIRHGLISLIPNLMPMIMAYGIWGLLFGEVSFAATVVSAMTFGIVVDDTVHFLWKYRHARTKLGLSPEEAIPQSFSTVGIAILVTTLSVVSGFTALAFSGFLVNSHLGSLTVMTLIAALLAVLLFLPPFLLVLDKRKS